MKGKALVVAPHADDETLGCGGTMAKLSSEGWEIFVLVMTNAAVGAPELFSDESITIVRNEALSAHSLLGVEQTRFLELPAPRLDQYPQYKIADQMREVFCDLRPDMLFLPHRGDLHMDHSTIFNAGLVAARPFAQEFHIRTILAYETLSETEWGHPYPDSAFIPNYFVALDEHAFSRKLDAMRCYESQLKAPPHPRSLEGLRALAAFRGSAICRQFAEAFMVVRTTNP